MELLIVILLGLALGSFATAIAYRIPRDIPWYGMGKGADGIPAHRSICTSCKAVLEPRDLVPFFSWAMSGGKCRRCGAKIGAQYPLIELGVAAACAGIYLSMGLNLMSAFAIAAVPILAALLVIDLEYLILPNELVAILGVLGLGRFGVEIFNDFHAGDWAQLHLYNSLTEHLGGAVAYGGLSWILGIIVTRVLKKEALGFGDVKFFAVAGLWLGLHALGWFMVVSGVAGIALALLWRALKRGRVFPFGPALIAAFYLLLISGRP